MARVGWGDFLVHKILLEASLARHTRLRNFLQYQRWFAATISNKTGALGPVSK